MLEELIEQLKEIEVLTIRYYTSDIKAENREADRVSISVKHTALMKSDYRYKSAFRTKHYRSQYEIPLEKVHNKVTGGDFGSKTRNNPSQADEAATAIQNMIDCARNEISDRNSFNPFRRHGIDH